MNVKFHNFHSMNFVSLLSANIGKYDHTIFIICLLSNIENSYLPLILLFAGILSTFFLLIFAFDPIFSFLVHYSLILNIASTSLKYSFYFQCHQMTKIVTKSYTTSSNLLVEQQ